MANHETKPSAAASVDERSLRIQVPRFSRRSLLAGAAGAAVAGVLYVGCEETVSAGPGLGADRAFFERLIEVVLPVKTGSTFVRPQMLPVLDHLDALLARIDPTLRVDLSMGIWLFNWSAVFLGLHGCTFLSLDDEAALSHCRRWQQGSITQRGLMNALKSIILVSYLREPATWPAIHYGGPVSARSGVPRLGNSPLPTEDRAPHVR